MKLGKILYFSCIFITAVLSAVMLKNSWIFLGLLMALAAVIGLISYLDIEYMNQKFTRKTYKSRRTEYFKSLTHEEQEKYLVNLYKEAEEKIKK